MIRAGERTWVSVVIDDAEKIYAQYPGDDCSPCKRKIRLIEEEMRRGIFFWARKGAEFMKTEVRVKRIKLS